MAVISAVVLVAALLYGERAPILRGIGTYLVIRDPLEKSDVVLLLAGDPATRPFAAARLLHAGYGARIVIARAAASPAVELGIYPNVTDQCIGVLEKLAVPSSRIVELRQPGGVASTRDEALLFRAWLRENPVRAAIVVTSEIHTRRAAWILRKTLAGTPIKLIMAPVPDRRFRAENWWTNEDGFIGCNNEYLRLLYYHLKY